MNTLQKFRLSNIVAAVAIAGLSLSAAYAVPNYTPDAATPTLAGDGGANLGFGLSLIEAQLPPGVTLVLPGVNDTPSGVKPTKDQFKAAVLAAAAVAATDADKAAVVRSALFIGANKQINISVPKDIVRGVLAAYLPTGSVAGAQMILNAALSVNNGKTNDVVAATILAIGDAGSGFESSTDDIAEGTFTTVAGLSVDQPLKAIALVKGMAENLIKNTKTNAGGTIGYNAATMTANVTEAITDLMAIVVSSNSKFLTAAAAHGAIQGIAPINGLVTGNVAYLAAFNAVAAGVGANPENRLHALAGAIRPLKITQSSLYDDAKAAFGNASATNALVAGYLAVQSDTGDNASRVAALLAANGPYVGASNDPANAVSYAIAAASANGAYGPLAVTALYGVGGVTTPQKTAILANVSRIQPLQAPKAAAAAVTAGLAATTALEAAIPNTYASQVYNVTKEVAKAATSTTADVLATAAINAAETTLAANPENDHKSAVVDIIGALIATRKLEIPVITTAAFAAADAGTGTREQVAAALGRGDNKVVHSTAGSTMMLAIAGYSTAEQNSVLAAERVARLAKSNGKTALNVALAEIRTVDITSLGGVIVGAGSTNNKLVNVVLTSALRQGYGTLTTNDEARLLRLAKAVNKKGELDVQLAFDTAKLVLADTDELYDIVHNQSVKYQKSVATVAGAAAAAAPGFAHFVARAAGKNAGTANAGLIATAIVDGADMHRTDANNPGAMAAITAGMMSGIFDQKNPVSADVEKMYVGAIKALIKTALINGNKGTAWDKLIPPTGTFRGVSLDAGQFGSGAIATGQPELGSAAVVTGAVSVHTTPASTAPSPMLIAILKAAGLAVKSTAHSQAAALAQAAGQAVSWITAGAAGTPYLTALAQAIYTGATGSTSAIPTNHPIYLAALAGKSEYQLGYKGAGAAGVLDYGHFNFNNSPVTDIFGM